MPGRQHLRRRTSVAALVGVLAAVLLGGAACSAPAPAASDHHVRPTASGAATQPTAAPAAPAAVTTAPSPKPTKAARPTRPVAGSALAVLATLRVKGRAPMTGYHRIADFGAAWLDVDRNGCDTRDDILRRDLTDPTGSGCHVLRGVLDDPYTGDVIDFVRGVGTSTAVQIDHVVSLGDAWQTGAQQLSEAKRVDLANDPINLLAVDGPTNERKGDGDAATWLPPNTAFRCTYVAHQVGVKKAYGLWVTAAEKAAMARVLRTCPAMRAPASSVSHVVLAVAAPAAPTKQPVSPTAHPDAGVVHPGAYCAPAGAGGHTTKGTPMTCRTSPTDGRDRWRSAD